MKTILKCIIVILWGATVYYPCRHAKYYHYIQDFSIVYTLVPLKERYNRQSCSLEFYERLISTHSEVNTRDLLKINTYEPPIIGGEYLPKDCQPIFKTAIIVPYRNRPEQLKAFLNYMHHFLQIQKIHYKIFIVDQQDNQPFNRGKLLNIGATVASNLKYPCLILHDIDLFPLSSQNIYACPLTPRHMSSAIDTFRFNLPYLEIVGGALAIQTEQYEDVNGMSNEFYGWGGEDDDFFQRLKANNLMVLRFSPEISSYSMLFHKKEKASNERWKLLENSIDRQQIDGLNSLQNNYNVHYKKLYTHIIV